MVSVLQGMSSKMAHRRLTYIVLLQRFDPIVAMIGKCAFDDGFYIVPPLARITENGAFLHHQPTDATVV
jgi:hypothetical protein